MPLGSLHLLRLFPMQSLDENSKSSIDLNLASIYASSAAQLSDSTMASHYEKLEVSNTRNLLKHARFMKFSNRFTEFLTMRNP